MTEIDFFTQLKLKEQNLDIYLKNQEKNNFLDDGNQKIKTFERVDKGRHRHIWLSQKGFKLCTKCRRKRKIW